LRMERKNMAFNVETLLQLAGDKEVGGRKYVKKLMKAFDKNANIRFHIEQLKTDKLKFELYTGPVTELMEAVMSRGSNRTDILKLSSTIQDEVKKKTQAEKVIGGKALSKIYLEDFKERFNLKFVGTGLPELDEKITEGFVPNTISVISGRPSMGKTIFMLNVISNLARAKRMLICEIEMGSLTLMDMLVSLHTGIDLSKIIKNPQELSDNDQKRIKLKVQSILKNKNLSFLDDPQLTLDRLEMELKNRQYDICFIDLFGRLADVTPTPEGFTKKLYQVKRIARMTGTHICLIHQIKRKHEKAKNMRPTLDGLKDSGTWEEVGDLIFGIHREKYYRPSLSKDVAEVIVMKQKRGESNVSVPYEFNGSICEFGEYETDYMFGRDTGDFL